MNTTNEPCTIGACCALLREVYVVEQKCDSIYNKLSEINKQVCLDLPISTLQRAALDMYEQSVRLRKHVEESTSDNVIKIIKGGRYEP